ncbi:APC family permease [Vagococcus zengguangii]|uniref:Amino acid permease n=1 Tax=Vagococcus zengguangii TaxID=2571750 RepID=A0A4D7CU79_9ENTE|nr:amino acid permease [Vagococcus zengguangii]QCI85901.1 amino acid permease [Vagococcus zengguangii]TLG78391.1 amino acid permease [Vagococcus zengguangii]
MKSELKKEITFFPALATVMGTVIGAGVFFKSATVYSLTDNESLGLIAWLLGGIISICAGLTGAELAASIPKTGGMMVYIERAYGKLASFLLGWAQTIVYFPANIAALSIIFATQFINLFHLNEQLLIIIAILCATSITLINLLGAKIGGAFQSITTIFKLIPLFLIIIFGLMTPHTVDVSLLPDSITASGSLWSKLGNGLLATMFAYDGWILVGNIAGEMKNPKKDLPKAISLGLFFVMIVYLLMNLALLFALPMSDIAGNSNASSDAAKVLFGQLGGKLVTLGILISVYGGINGYTMTGMRVPFAMAERQLLPFNQFFLKLTNKTKVPFNSSLVILAIAILMMFSGSFDLLTDMLVFVIWIFYTLTFVAVFILRKREPDLARPYKVPLYPVIPLVAILGGLFIVINTLFTQTSLALVGILLTVLGLPVYYFKQKK